MKYAQCKLRSGSTERVCWLPAHRVRPKLIVTLKDEVPSRAWRVIWVGSDLREKDELNSGWHVGGL